MDRRNFTKTAGLGLLALQSFPIAAADEFKRNIPSAQSRIPLGVCNHSLRGLRPNANQLLDYAIDQKLDSVLLNTLQPFESHDKKYLTGLRKKAQTNGITIYTGVGSISEKSQSFSNQYGNAETLLRKGIEVATLVGSPIVGCRIGSIKDRYIKGGIKTHVDEAVKLMRSMHQQALDARIKFAFENHMGDLRSEELLELIHETGIDSCGALFDPNNALWAMENPLEALKNLGSNVLCTSVRDVCIWETEDGAEFQGKAIGEGMIDFKLFSQILAENCPGVPLQIETISNSNRAIPYLKEGFWEGFPDLQARDFVKFQNIVKSGVPQEIIDPPPGIDKKSFDIELQQSEQKTSIDYLRKYCNAGLKT